VCGRYRYSLVLAVLVASFLVSSSYFARADLDLGIEAYDGGDYATALREIRMAANKGNPLAQTMLAGLYLVGDGVHQNYFQARNWYEKAALNGDGNAQLNLGFIYRDGLGVKPDVIRAYKWFAIASAQNKHHQTYLSEIEKRMSQSDVVRARNRVDLWLRHNQPE